MSLLAPPDQGRAPPSIAPSRPTPDIHGPPPLAGFPSLQAIRLLRSALLRHLERPRLQPTGNFRFAAIGDLHDAVILDPAAEARPDPLPWPQLIEAHPAAADRLAAMPPRRSAQDREILETLAALAETQSALRAYTDQIARAAIHTGDQFARAHARRGLSALLACEAYRAIAGAGVPTTTAMLVELSRHISPSIHIPSAIRVATTFDVVAHTLASGADPALDATIARATALQIPVPLVTALQDLQQLPSTTRLPVLTLILAAAMRLAVAELPSRTAAADAGDTASLPVAAPFTWAYAWAALRAWSAGVLDLAALGHALRTRSIKLPLRTTGHRLSAG